jgi:hypothetical protein
MPEGLPSGEAVAFRQYLRLQPPVTIQAELRVTRVAARLPVRCVPRARWQWDEWESRPPDTYADPSHPEHGESKTWAGRRFDPEKFDMPAVNRKLGSLLRRLRRLEQT